MNRNLIFVAVLLFASVNCQLKYDQELYTHSCIPGDLSSPTLYASFNPSYDTPGCQVPYCIGAIAGQFMNFSVKYTAKRDVQGGTIIGSLTGLTLSTPENDPLRFLVPLTVPSLLIDKLLKCNPDICVDPQTGQNRTEFCPQINGNDYTLKSTVQFPPLISTATVVLEWQAILHDGYNEILCFKFYGRLVAPNILSSLSSLPQYLGNVLG